VVAGWCCSGIYVSILCRHQAVSNTAAHLRVAVPWPDSARGAASSDEINEVKAFECSESSDPSARTW
jgi:hypothetical protein